jgi:M6 family metalloprotease-like protein
MRRFLLIVTGMLMPMLLLSNYFSNLPYTITQPNGVVIHCFVSGDEYFNWLHDNEGFTIIQASDGYYYYGKVSGDLVVPTRFKVGSVDPSKTGLAKWAKISAAEYRNRRIFYEREPLKAAGKAAPHSGTLNNLVVYIRFSDDTEFTTTRQNMDYKFNSDPGVSLKTYFADASYNKLTISSTHYPDCPLTTNYSYQDSHPRGYYKPYNDSTNTEGYTGGDNGSQRTSREHTLLKNAIDWIALNSPVPGTLNLDGDNDNQIDNVCFIIRGSNEAWSSLLWAHSWALYSYNVTINGDRLYRYTFQPETQINVQTLCHEMFHALGSPDLYHYTGNGISPVSSWDLMESGFGHMGAYMKWKYSNHSWISSIPEISSSGTYTLNPLASPTNNCYKIRSPYSESQFFIVEYRKKEGTYESNVPGSGLLVYRIDSYYSGNAGGPPDEVYIYRPDGTTSANGSPSLAHFSSETGRTTINDGTNPSSFLQNGTVGGLDISNVTSAGNTISFTVTFNFVFNPSNFTTSNVGSSQVDLQWNKNGQNDHVVLAWSTTSTFGTPENDSIYSAGDTIPGGGIVLTAGADTAFSHAGLESGETFYYKLWSVNSEGTYSSGVALNASTWCPIYATFPYTQPFSNAKKPGCWSIQSNRQPAQNWQFGTITGLDTLPNLTGNYAYLNSYGYGNGSTQDADLISPYFNFSNYTNIVVSFDHYFMDKGSGQGTFSYSTNYGQSWVTVQQFTSTTATNPEIYSVDLTGDLQGANYVKFKLNYSGSYEKYWAVDNFNVDAELDISDTLTITSGQYGEGFSQCFNALQSIVVGGSERGSVELFPYASATFIAGSSIRFLPGFHAHEMSQVDAHITTENAFCTTSQGNGVLAMQEKSATHDASGVKEAAKERTTFKVYPNPNEGRFTVETGEEESPSEITLYNMIGAKVGKSFRAEGRYTTIDLQPLDKGIYFIAVSNGKTRQIKKMVVQ